jgi:hypothetical protein
MIVWRFVFPGLAPLVFAACQATQTPTTSSGLSREQFVDLYLELRNAQNTARSMAELETMRNAIFTRAGASPDQMTRFVAEHGDEIKFMSTVWDSIKNRLDLASGLTPR